MRTLLPLDVVNRACIDARVRTNEKPRSLIVRIALSPWPVIAIVIGIVAVALVARLLSSIIFSL